MSEFKSLGHRIRYCVDRLHRVPLVCLQCLLRTLDEVGAGPNSEVRNPCGCSEQALGQLQLARQAVRVAIGEVELAYRLGWAKEHVEPVVSVAKKKCKGCKHWRKHDEWGKCMQRTDGDRERDCEGWAAKASTAGLSDTPLTVGFGIKMYCQSCYWWQQGLCYRVPQTFEKRRDDYCGEWRHRRWFKAEDETLGMAQLKAALQILVDGFAKLDQDVWREPRLDKSFGIAYWFGFGVDPGGGVNETVTVPLPRERCGTCRHWSGTKTTRDLGLMGMCNIQTGHCSSSGVSCKIGRWEAKAEPDGPVVVPPHEQRCGICRHWDNNEGECRRQGSIFQTARYRCNIGRWELERRSHVERRDKSVIDRRKPGPRMDRRKV